MKYTMARYTVKPDKVKEVKRAICEFVDEVRLHDPRTLYLVFREGTTATFLHLMCFENEAAQRRHELSRYNDRFAKKVFPNCVGRPTFSEINLFAASKKHWMLQI